MNQSHDTVINQSIFTLINTDKSTLHMKSKTVIFYLVLLIGSFSQVNSDLYTPSMPAIIQGLSTSVAMVQRSLSLFLLGFAFAQLIYGPLSDSLGRKKPMIIGTFTGLLGSTICLCATDINIFLLGRSLQGIGAGCGLVLGRAILRDCFQGTAFASFISYLSIGTISIMASAPVLGGYLQDAFGWHGCFAFLTLYGTILLILIIWALPETLDHNKAHALSLSQAHANFKELLSNTSFLGYCSILFLIYGGMLSWLAVGPIYLQHQRHLSPTSFGWIAFVVGASSALGALINARLVKRFDPGTVLQGALTFMLCASLLFLLFELRDQNTLPIIILLLIGYVGPTILVLANTLTKALGPFGHIAGIGFAVVGCVQIIGGACLSALISVFSTQTLLPLSIAFVLTSGCSLLINTIIKSQTR